MEQTLTQEKLTQKITSSNTWSDMIRSIEQEKRKDLNTAEFVPTKRVTMFEKKRLERIVDPVAMKYRDPQSEKEYQDRKSAAIQQRATNALLEMSKKFDIVSHQGPPRKIEKDPPRILKTTSTRPYHILTNMKKIDHEKAPLVYDDEFVQEKTKREPRILNLSVPNKREFDVVSNNYYIDNDTRQIQDKESIREHVNTVYWKTHDLDIIKGQFYSNAKEGDFQEQLKLAASVQGLSQQLRLPPSIKYSEGNSYNILQQTVTNEDRMRVTAKLSTGHISHASEIQARQREAGITRMELEEQRRVNRPDFKRWQPEIDRGFDLIKNIPKEALLPHPVRPVTVWTRLQESNNAQPFSRQVASSSGQPKSAGHTPFTRTNGADAGLDIDVGTTNYRNLSSGPGDANNRELLSPINNKSRMADKLKVPISSKPATAGPVSTSRVPTLDLALAEPPEPVAYREVAGPPGLSIPIVRTGGLNSTM